MPWASKASVVAVAVVMVFVMVPTLYRSNRGAKTSERQRS
jgi:hypothetical protein